MMDGSGNGAGELLTREGILALVTPQRRRVDVPEWAGHVYVSSLRGVEYVEYVEALNALLESERPQIEKNLAGACLLLAFSLTDEQGARLFKVGDVARLVDAPQRESMVLLRLWQEVRSLNPTGAQPEVLAKNSGPDLG